MRTALSSARPIVTSPDRGQVEGPDFLSRKDDELVGRARRRAVDRGPIGRAVVLPRHHAREYMPTPHHPGEAGAAAQTLITMLKVRAAPSLAAYATEGFLAAPGGPTPLARHCCS